MRGIMRAGARQRRRLQAWESRLRTVGHTEAGLCPPRPPAHTQTVEWDMLLFFASMFVMIEASAGGAPALYAARAVCKGWGFGVARRTRLQV